MKKLILIRHAQPDPSNHLLCDFEFPLSKRGRRDALEMADRFAGLKLCPELILVSPAKRTRETAELFAKKLGFSKKELVIKNSLYEAERGDILRVVHELDNSFDTVMIMGHNPAIISMVHQLVDHNFQNMPPGSVVVLEIDRDAWREVGFGSTSMSECMMPEEKVEDHTGWRWRFMFWRRQRIQKVELFVVFLVGLLMVMGLVAWGVSLANKP